MNTHELSEWYYLMYLGPGGIALLLLLLSAVSGGGRHHRANVSHGHSHGGVKMHHGGPKAHHGGPKAHHAGPKHAAPKHGARTNAPSHNAVQQTLAWFGIGRMPGLFVWGSALLGWGLFGYWGTRISEAALHAPALFVLPALATAIFGAAATAKLTAEAGARLLPQENSTATDTVELCGLTGTVAFPVDETRGRVHVYDTYGTLHDVQAVAAPGQPPIARGQKVFVTDFDAARKLLIVELLP